MTEQERDELYENIMTMTKIKGYLQYEFFRLSGMDPDRIAFLYDDNISHSKRYERFEKKKFSELHDYLKSRCPLLQSDELENSILEYIINTVTLPIDTKAFAFKAAIANSAATREFIKSLFEKSIGMQEDPNREEFIIVNRKKVVGALTYIKNEIRKSIRNALCSKAFYENGICESNYTIACVFSETEKDLIVSNIISSTINYIILQSETDITPNELDYQGMQAHKNAQIDALLQEIKALANENEALSKKLVNKSKKNNTKTVKKIKIDNPDVTKENKILKQEIDELRGFISELESIISMSEGADEIEEDVLRDVRNDRILFVGGHDNELRKLKFIFKNSEAFNKCSTGIQANYVQGFDYIVFFAHYSSHSLYHKIKGLADQMNVPYIHCEYNNPKIIAEYIAKHFPNGLKEDKTV